jgi:hypothetical protein
MDRDQKDLGEDKSVQKQHQDGRDFTAHHNRPVNTLHAFSGSLGVGRFFLSFAG